MELQRNRNKVYRVDESIFEINVKNELDRLARKQKLQEEKEKQ
jgi:hypothetical protein